MYLLDANILIRAHGDYYALDRVPPFWEWLQHHGQAGAVKIPSEIYEEMAGGGAPRPGDLLVPHLRQAALKRALILREETDINVVQAVLAAAYGTATPTELELEEMGQDPLLVAYAVADAPNRTVVTYETSKRTQRGARAKVPDACADVGVRCITPYAFFRELDFALDWRSRLGLPA